MTTTQTLHHLQPGTIFRDRDALWRVIEGGDSDNIRAQRIASWDVNNTQELHYHLVRSHHWENYNAYNEVVLVAGIYEVVSSGFRSPNIVGGWPAPVDVDTEDVDTEAKNA